MGAFKKKYIYNSKYYEHIRFFSRYIGDLFFIWIWTTAELEGFYIYINKVCKTVKFTKEHPKNKITFLGAIITPKEDDTIEPYVFQNETDA